MARCPIVVGLSDVPLVAHEPLDRRGVPDLLPPSRPPSRRVQLAEDPVDRRPLLGVPGKHLPHHRRFVLGDPDLPIAPVLARPVSVSVGRLWRRKLAATRPVQPPPPAAIEHLGALVLRDRPLDLEQQLVVGGVIDRPLAEEDLHTRALQLLQQDHLVGVPPSESIGAQDDHHVLPTFPRVVPQLVQRGTIQPSAAVPVVGVRQRLGVPEALLIRESDDGGELALDRLLLLLQPSRNSRIECRTLHPRLLPARSSARRAIHTAVPVGRRRRPPPGEPAALRNRPPRRTEVESANRPDRACRGAGGGEGRIAPG